MSTALGSRPGTLYHTRYAVRVRNEISPDGRGRLLLPKDARAALGVLEGGNVAVELRSDGSVLLRHAGKAEAESAARAIDALRGSMKGDGPSVSEFLAGRRREAKLEDEQEARLASGA
jgi:bifunctional DNA-binding transcriptional regulator/antitoxin component of YhaV-PrlF toxin-antitoxin module